MGGTVVPGGWERSDIVPGGSGDAPPQSVVVTRDLESEGDQPFLWVGVGVPQSSLVSLRVLQWGFRSTSVTSGTPLGSVGASECLSRLWYTPRTGE